MVILRHALRTLRLQILAYGAGLAAWGVLEAALFPTVRETLSSVEYPAELLEAFGAAGGNLADPRTFMDVEFFSLGPIVLATFALFASTGALAGEESGGTMELLGSWPLSRRRMFGEKALAVVLALSLACVVISIGWALVMPLADFGRDLPLWRLVAATFTQMSFAVFMIATGFLLGAVAPSRGAAGAWTAVVLTVSYLLVLIAGITDSVEDLRYASPYYYSDLSGILARGADVEHQVALWAASGLLGWLALRGFEGRELGSERWQFAALLRGGPRRLAVAPGAPVSERLSRWGQGRSRVWWAGAVAVLVLLGGGAGALGGTLAERGDATRTITADGYIDAPNARLVAPASGTLRALTAAAGDDVASGQDIGWMQNALDGSTVPLRAPIAGRVALLRLRGGEFVPVGTTVAVIYDLKSLYAVLEVDAGDVDEIAPRAPVEITLAALGLTAETRVDSVTRVPLSGDASRASDDPKYEVKTAPLASTGGGVVGMQAEGRITARARQ